MNQFLRKSIIPIVIILSLFAPLSCAKSRAKESAVMYGHQEAKRAYREDVPDAHEETAPGKIQENGTAIIDRKLIKEGHIRFETADMEKTRQTIGKLIEKYGAYISREDEHNTLTSIYHNITVRIPKQYFDLFLAELTDGIKKIDEKSIDIQDVTEEFIDISARLKVKKETEAGYLRLLTQAKTIKDILDIQNQIQYLRSDIESIEGRLRYLENAVNFSTLHLRIRQPIADTSPAASVFMPVWEALKGGVRLFAAVFVAVLYGWVFLILTGVVLFVILKFRKTKRKKQSET